MQAQAPKPYPELKQLERFVGQWSIEGEGKATPIGKAGKTSYTGTVNWIPGGFFLHWQGTLKTPDGEFKGIEIDSYEPVTKKFIWNNFASDGGVQTFTYTIEGNTVSYSGTQVIGGKRVKVRGTITFAPDFMNNVEKREISIDGKTWMPALEAKATKVKSSPK